MTERLALLVAALVGAGCNPSSPASREAAPSTPSTAAATAEPGPTASAAPRTSAAAPAPAPAPSAATVERCISDCVASRQMEAIAPQMIEAKCREQCQRD